MFEYDEIYRFSVEISKRKNTVSMGDIYDIYIGKRNFSVIREIEDCRQIEKNRVLILMDEYFSQKEKEYSSHVVFSDIYIDGYIELPNNVYNSLSIISNKTDGIIGKIEHSVVNRRINKKWSFVKSPGFCVYRGFEFEFDNTFRIYVYAKYSLILEISKKICIDLEDMKVKFCLKFSFDFHKTFRVDRIVIYLRKSELSRLVRIVEICDRASRICDFDIISSPYFTRRISGAVSIALSPRSGISFGRFISELLFDTEVNYGSLSADIVYAYLVSKISKSGFSPREIWRLDDVEFGRSVEYLIG